MEILMKIVGSSSSMDDRALLLIFSADCEASTLLKEKKNGYSWKSPKCNGTRYILTQWTSNDDWLSTYNIHNRRFLFSVVSHWLKSWSFSCSWIKLFSSILFVYKVTRCDSDLPSSLTKVAWCSEVRKWWNLFWSTTFSRWTEIKLEKQLRCKIGPNY